MLCKNALAFTYALHEFILSYAPFEFDILQSLHVRFSCCFLTDINDPQKSIKPNEQQLTSIPKQLSLCYILLCYCCLQSW